MSDTQFDDLKQFIDARASQTEAFIRHDVNGLKVDLKRLEKKVDDGFAGIGEAIMQINDQHADLEGRVTKLEEQAA